MKTVELGRSGRRSRQQPEIDNLFGWTVFILLLCGFAVACWIGTFYIFTHPEEPFNYHILAKLKKLDPPKRFELTAAPVARSITFTWLSVPRNVFAENCVRYTVPPLGA